MIIIIITNARLQGAVAQIARHRAELQQILECVLHQEPCRNPRGRESGVGSRETEPGVGSPRESGDCHIAGTGVGCFSQLQPPAASAATAEEARRACGDGRRGGTAGCGQRAADSGQRAAGGRQREARRKGQRRRGGRAGSPATMPMVVGSEAAHTPSRLRVRSSMPEATTSGGAHSKQAVSPGTTSWMWPLTCDAPAAVSALPRRPAAPLVCWSAGLPVY